MPLTSDLLVKNVHIYSNSNLQLTLSTLSASLWTKTFNFKDRPLISSLPKALQVNGESQTKGPRRPWAHGGHTQLSLQSMSGDSWLAWLAHVRLLVQRTCQCLNHSLNLRDASGPQQEQRVLQTLSRASQRVQQNSLGPGWRMVGNDCWNKPARSGMTQGPQDATRVSLSVQEGLVKVNPKNGRQAALRSFPRNQYMSLVSVGRQLMVKTEKLGNQGGTHSG